MKVLILGAGRVGGGLAERLAGEGNDVTVVDSNSDLLLALQSQNDLRTVHGSADSIEVLRDAGADASEVLIAVTSTDEVNLVACQLGHRVFSIPQRLARLRAPQWLRVPNLLSDDGFAVSCAISPERSLIDYLMRLVDYPGATQVFDFANGLMHLVAVKVDAASRLLNHRVRDIHDDPRSRACRIVAIFRGGQVFIPLENSVITEHDEVFFIAAIEDAHRVSQLLHHPEKPVARVMIIGGGHVGAGLAEALSSRLTPRLIEQDPQRCRDLSVRLNGKAIVVEASGIDEEVLEAEQVDAMDMVFALTSDDEDNIMASMLARRLGAKRSVAIVNRRSYAELIGESMVDVAVTPADITLGAVLQFIRRADVSVLHSIRSGMAEALEIVVRPRTLFRGVANKMIGDIKMPSKSSLVAIVRREGLGPARVLFADPGVRLVEGDHAIVLILDRKVITKIESLFGMKSHVLGF